MKRLFTTLLLVAVTFGAWAQNTNDEPTVEQLAAEVEALKTKTSKWDKISERIKIGGMLQLQYLWANEGSDASTFNIRRARFDIKGDLIKNKLDYRFQIEFANSPKIVDAYLNYKPFNELKIKFGQYKLPFTIENTVYTPTKLEFVNYPMGVEKLLPSTGRDMGLNLYGNLWSKEKRTILSYDLGVMNGQGINSKDKNKSKDIVARLMVHPVKGLTVSGSYYKGEYGPEYLQRDRYAVGAAYDEGPVVVRGEWIGGRTGAVSDEGAYGTFDSSSWYAVAGWRFAKNWMGAVRYEGYTENTDIDSSGQQNYTLGFTWQPIKYLRCQIDYTFQQYGKNNPNPNRSVVGLMLTASF